MNAKDLMLHQPAIIVHGGAWEIPKELQEDAKEGCSRAAAAGWDALMNGGSAVQAVEAAVRVLEDDPTFDAGRGAVLNAVGEIELDAIIMDGVDLNLGAVLAVKNLPHPITLARLVMTESEHAVLACAGAEAFARSQELPFCPAEALIVRREAERWRNTALEKTQGSLSEAYRRSESPRGTVGAVALDDRGHVAAATSTGGTFNKQPGRVGDSPLVGCGAYADDCVGAVSATGDGEQLMKIVISKSACDFLERGKTAQQAADAAISLLTERTDGQGGLIVLGKRGDIGMAHSTQGLAYAYVGRERMHCGIRV